MTAFLGMVADRLEGVDESPRSRRLRLLAEHQTVPEFASRFDHTFITTPAVSIIAERALGCFREDEGRLVVSMPPQEGKTTTLRNLCVRILTEAPETRIAYVSYAASLARASGRFVRDRIRDNAHDLGISIHRSQGDASAWQLDGHQGGMVSVGVGGGLTGRPVDFLIIDDPIRNQKDADSPIILEAIEEWWRTVGLTRLSPTASVIVTQTRWAEQDLAGNRIAEDWPLVNIPAVADGKTPDALGREPGAYMISARRRTPEQFKSKRREVGERAWAALYMGRPAPLEGGIFKSRWLADGRVAQAPELTRCLVMIDPADNSGSGDEAGVIAGGTGVDGDYYILADRSGHYTVGEWFRVAFLLALEVGAEALGYERSLSGLDRRLRAGWKDIRSEALTLSACGWIGDAEVDQKVITRALLDLLPSTADAETRTEKRAQLGALWTHVGTILDLPETGLPVRPVRAEGSKSYRAQLASPLVQNRKVHLVGVWPVLEHVLVTWREGKPSPDRMDAFVYLVLNLARVGGFNFVAPKAEGERGAINTKVQRSRSRFTSGMRLRP